MQFDNKDFRCNLKKDQQPKQKERAMIAQRVSHPMHVECLPGEVFIGNMTRSRMESLSWTTKREGQICYCEEGHIIPQGGSIREQRLVPVFVAESEYDANDIP